MRYHPVLLPHICKCYFEPFFSLRSNNRYYHLISDPKIRLDPTWSQNLQKSTLAILPSGPRYVIFIFVLALPCASGPGIFWVLKVTPKSGCALHTYLLQNCVFRNQNHQNSDHRIIFQNAIGKSPHSYEITAATRFHRKITEQSHIVHTDSMKLRMLFANPAQLSASPVIWWQHRTLQT